MTMAVSSLFFPHFSAVWLTYSQKECHKNSAFAAGLPFASSLITKNGCRKCLRPPYFNDAAQLQRPAGLRRCSRRHQSSETAFIKKSIAVTHAKAGDRCSRTQFSSVYPGNSTKKKQSDFSCKQLAVALQTKLSFSN